MRYLFVLLVAALSCAADRGNKMKQAADVELPAIVVEAESRYLLGFPLLVAVIFDSSATRAEFYDLPEFDPTTEGVPISVRLEPVGPGVPVAARAPARRDGAPGMTMKPGERRRMSLDLSNFGLEIKPGAYALSFVLTVAKYSRASAPVRVEFVRPSPAEEQEAARLRRLGDPPADTGAWEPFLTQNWTTVVLRQPISAEGMRQLSLHLFLHRAIYGPQPVGRLDPAPLRAITGSVLEPEALAMQYEILWARSDARAGVLAREIVNRWPAMQHRLDKVDGGEGLLTFARSAYGRDADLSNPPAAKPYE